MIEEQKPEPPNCQQCRRNPATHKTPVSKGVGFRWKCDACFKRLMESGFKKPKGKSNG
jgi:ribosomal protein L37AE/L43A